MFLPSSAMAVQALTAERHEFPELARGRAHSRLEHRTRVRAMIDLEHQTSIALQLCASARGHIEMTAQLVRGSRKAIASSQELLSRTAHQAIVRSR